jgi:bacteriocin biosynthesis cyclodehydratase domain-containing protein
MRPILAPGTHVLRRGDGSVQVGLLAPARLMVSVGPGRAAGTEVVAADSAGAAPDDPRVLEVLTSRGLLLDESAVLPMCSGPVGDPRRHAAAALALTSGSSAATVRARRAGSHVQVLGFGHPVGLRLPALLDELLREAGIGAATAKSADASPPAVGVLVGVGEPDRELVDAWTRASTPHLLVRFVEGRSLLGPFVHAGRTACLRCIDAHRTDADPAWPLLVRQYAESSSRDRLDGVPEPLDPLLVRLALAWAARDVTAYVDGRRPWTWSATLTLQPHLGDLETASWLRHPECGCSAA